MLLGLIVGISYHRYILTNCAKYKLSNEVAKQELGQLGKGTFASILFLS